MFVVGLTGGIGSGKSTVAELFAQKGVPIIDADVIAKSVTESNSDAFQQIITHFGNNILLPDGHLNRNELRHIIFSNPHERLWLERLLHPIIRIEMENQIKALKSSYCIAVIPLLLEVEFFSFINRILVVDAPEEMQIARASLRDQKNKAEIKAIIKTQANREMRISKAHDVIVNDGNILDLETEVTALHLKYLKLSGQA